MLTQIRSLSRRWPACSRTLAHFGKEGKPESVVPKISQEVLAEMIGTTRSRVSFFINRFRKLGFIHYNGSLQVHSSLLNVVLRD
jgi:CRP-like cAMP-binding protein